MVLCFSSFPPLMRKNPHAGLGVYNTTKESFGQCTKSFIAHWTEQSRLFAISDFNVQFSNTRYQADENILS